jgi:hypothetical protein
MELATLWAEIFAALFTLVFVASEIAAHVLDQTHPEG